VRFAYVGHHTGTAMNPLTGAVEPNGTSIVDVSDPANPNTSLTFRAQTHAGEEAGGAQMVRCLQRERSCHNGGAGEVVPCFDLWGPRRRKFMMSPIRPTPSRLTVIVEGLTGTHKNWWECDTGIAYLVGNKSSEGWKGGKSYEDL